MSGVQPNHIKLSRELSVLAGGDTRFPIVAKALMDSSVDKKFLDSIMNEKEYDLKMALIHFLTMIYLCSRKPMGLTINDRSLHDVVMQASDQFNPDLKSILDATDPATATIFFGKRIARSVNGVIQLLAKWSTLEPKTQAFCRKFLKLKNDKGHVSFDSIRSENDLLQCQLSLEEKEFENSLTARVKAIQINKDDDIVFELGLTSKINRIFDGSNDFAPLTILELSQSGHPFKDVYMPTLYVLLCLMKPNVVLDISSASIKRMLADMINDLEQNTSLRSRSKAKRAELSADLIDFSMGGVIYVRDRYGHLERIESNGERKPVKGSMDGDLIPVNRCYTSGLDSAIANDEPKCNQFVFECLINEDSENLNTCIQNYYTGHVQPENMMREDIKRMHPMVAYRTLQKFGFQYYSVVDPVANTKLKKVESVKHWKKHVLGSSDPKHANIKNAETDFGRATNLEKYLEMVVQFVNANPAILNENYTGTSSEASGIFRAPAEYEKMGVQKYIPHKQRASFQLQNALVGRHRMSILDSNNFASQLNPFAGVYGANDFSAVFAQAGGGVTEDLAGSQTGAYYLRSIFRVVLDQLKARGKSITTRDEEYINKKLNDLVMEEQNAYKWVNYVEGYARILDFLGDDGQGEVSFDQLKELVDKQSGVMSGKQQTENKLTKILATLEGIAEKQKDGKNYYEL